MRALLLSFALALTGCSDAPGLVGFSLRAAFVPDAGPHDAGGPVDAGPCGAGGRLCAGTCLPSTACCTVSDCGPSGDACDAGECTCGGLVCDAGFACALGSCVCPSAGRLCAGGSCVPRGGCCSTADCSGGQVCQAGACVCTGGACSCQTGQKVCDGGCIASVDCCANSDCTVDSDTCTGGTCHCGTAAACDGGAACVSGACKEPNGAACSAPGQCQSNACTTFYRDADSDTFGNAAAPAAFCGTAPPSGYVADHTDCCDSDANAKPGQSAWFTTLDKCGSWDYDCDGGVEYEYSGTGCNTISSGCPYCSYGTNVWSGSVPSCGNPGTWVTNCTSTSTACSPGSSYCTASGSSRTQACH